MIGKSGDPFSIALASERLPEWATDAVTIGETSIMLAVEVWVLREGQGDRVKVTDAEFKFVALNDSGSPRPVVAQPN